MQDEICLHDTPFDDAALAIARRAYARQILAAARVGDNPRLEAAFASVTRERFLGAKPWNLVPTFRRGETIQVTDLVIAYQDVLFALAPHRGVNNGQPSLHAAWLHRAALKPGDRVAHIGAGTGYYTALIAHLVGPRGRIVAVEFDPALAEIATRNLAHLANVTIVPGDGFAWPRESVDCVYVNFSVERPAETWLDNLAPGGRLIFPLGVPRPSPSPGGGTHAQHGAGLHVTRVAQGFAAEWLGPADFVCAEGPSTDAKDDRARLAAAISGGGVEFVRSLTLKQPSDPARAWFTGSGWSLGYDPPE